MKMSSGRVFEPTKATGYFSTVLATPFYSRLTIFGSEGWVEVRGASHPDEAGPSALTAQRRTLAPIVTTLWDRHGIRPIGFWITLLGKSSNELTYILAWDSLADRELKWTAFQDDPPGTRFETKANARAPLSRASAVKCSRPCPSRH
jgi:NIPSNAP